MYNTLFAALLLHVYYSKTVADWVLQLLVTKTSRKVKTRTKTILMATYNPRETTTAVLLLVQHKTTCMLCIVPVTLLYRHN